MIDIPLTMSSGGSYVADTSRRQDCRHEASLDVEVLLVADVLPPTQSVAPIVPPQTLAEPVLCNYLETRGELKALKSKVVHGQRAQLSS